MTATTDQRVATDANELLLADEVSAITRAPVKTLAYWRSIGQGPDWFRLGGRRVVYRRGAVIRWLAEQEAATRSKSA